MEGYRQENKEKIKERDRKYYLKNKEKWKEYNQKNKQRIDKRREKWRKSKNGQESDRRTMIKRYKEMADLKTKLVNYKGGKCQKCGYNKYMGALDFHHSKGKKEFEISGSNLTQRSMVELKKEVDKCILVCANCHREIHYQERETGRNKK